MAKTRVLSAVSAFAVLAGTAFAASAPGSAPVSTPVGITLQNVTFRNELLWTRLADLNGKPLYTFDSDALGGAPTCVGECTKEFEPYLVARGAVDLTGSFCTKRFDRN